jgi:hypothetical protein
MSVVDSGDHMDGRHWEACRSRFAGWFPDEDGIAELGRQYRLSLAVIEATDRNQGVMRLC